MFAHRVPWEDFAVGDDILVNPTGENFMWRGIVQYKNERYATIANNEYSGMPILLSDNIFLVRKG